jgi:hypothetical protein
MRADWLEQITGVKPPYTQAAFFELVAMAIFLAAIFWPHLSTDNLIKALIIGAVWAVSGFLAYLRVRARTRPG